MNPLPRKPRSLWSRLKRRLFGRGDSAADQTNQRILRAVQQSVARGALARPNLNFTFIVGASGSGTTLLTQILSHPRNTVCLGGKYWTVDQADAQAWQGMQLFNRSITALWDRQGDLERVEQARTALPHIADLFFTQTGYRDRDHLIYKRSAPFNPGDRYRPDLSDLFDLFPAVRVVIIYRDPRAATVSSLRRGFAPTLRQCAVICEEQLTYMAAQAATLPAERLAVLPYEAFCEAPLRYVGPLAAFTGLAAAELAAGVERFGVAADRVHGWQTQRTPDELAFLDRFFDGRRLRQWSWLANHRMQPDA